MSPNTAGPLLPGEGFNEALREALPGPVVSLLEVATHLGDGAFLIVLAVVLYWFGREDRREVRAFVIAIGVAALALAVGLKGIFEVPRPNLAFAPVGYDGYSFPSAHAMGAAAFYAALAVVMDLGTRRGRYAVAGTLITVVALSRVVMGVHYLADVLFGVALGLALVAVGIRYLKRQPCPVFVLAFVIAVAAVLLGSREFVTLSVGAALGGAIGWATILDVDRPPSENGASILVLGVLLLPTVLVIRVVSGVVPVPPLATPVETLAETLAYAVATAAVLGVPYLARELDDWPVVERLQDALPFRDRRVDFEEFG